MSYDEIKVVLSKDSIIDSVSLKTRREAQSRVIFCLKTNQPLMTILSTGIADLTDLFNQLKLS